MTTDTFHIMSAVFSMVLGLGVTRLLLGLVTVFRLRRQVRIDWLPLCWAASLFTIQLQYWWGINLLPSYKTSYSFLDFVGLVLLIMMLFLAAALLLPSRSEDEKQELRDFFHEEGRYSLLAIAAFNALTFPLNAFILHHSIHLTGLVLDIAVMAIPLAVFFGSRRMQAILTLAYLPILLLDIAIG